MICDSCGYNNQPNATTCIRCGQPLPVGEPAPASKVPSYKRPDQTTGSKVTTLQPAAGMPKDVKSTVGYFPSQPAEVAQPMSPKSTVLQVPSQPAAEEQSEHSAASSLSPKKTVCQKITSCPQCQYPIIGDVEKCPECGTVVKKEEKEAEAPSKADLYSSKGETTKEKTIFRPFNKTPKSDPAPAEEKKTPKCSLSIVKEANENIDDRTNTYEGAEIELKRENTEPSNLTITSKVQAKLTCENGHWYIENCSEMHTTYIQVTRRMEVMPGDTVILGDRSFTFGVDDK